MKDSSVAVVIAHFNGTAVISKALASVYCQSQLPAEVIIVDDGSSASELKNLYALQGIHNFTIFEQQNSGQAAARNLGVKNSKSEFICFLDQDDYFLSNHIEDLLKAWDPSDNRMAFTYGDLWRQTESGVIYTHSCIQIEGNHPHKSLEVMIRNNVYILPSASLISKAAFEEVGGFDEQFRGYEDDDLFVRFFANGYSNRFVEKPVSVWTLNESSTSFSEAMSRSRFLYFRKLLETIPSESLPGTFVFGNILVPRFAFQFAADVISASFNKSPHFDERQKRLREFLTIFRLSKEVVPSSKRKFLIVTYPLVTLRSNGLRVLLHFALKMSWLLEKTGLPGIGLFLSHYARK